MKIFRKNRIVYVVIAIVYDGVIGDYETIYGIFDKYDDAVRCVEEDAQDRYIEAWRMNKRGAKGFCGYK